jgi:hypothetical protein
MNISCRDLFKTSANISQYPWNVSPDSEASPDERPETGTDEIVSDEFVKVKVKEGPLTVNKNFINWETINQLGLPVIEEKKINFTRSNK